MKQGQAVVIRARRREARGGWQLVNFLAMLRGDGEFRCCALFAELRGVERRSCGVKGTRELQPGECVRSGRQEN